MKIVSVGSGGNPSVPEEYKTWEKVYLDIDSRTNPDICIDARNLKDIPGSQFDVAYCSHCLEHFSITDVPKVLEGFNHILVLGGKVDIIVPDIGQLLREMISRNLDVDDVWYRVAAGPITFHDVLYGWSKEIVTGNDYYNHKSGFTALKLVKVLEEAGFININISSTGFDLRAIAEKQNTATVATVPYLFIPTPVTAPT